MSDSVVSVIRKVMDRNYSDANIPYRVPLGWC